MAAMILVSGLAVRAAVAAGPLADTPETRRAAAEAFLVAVPVNEEVTRLIAEIGEQVPEDRRGAFVDEMTSHVDMSRMTQIMLEGLVGALTATELRAAAAFFGSPEGRAVREKLPHVIDRVMPLIRDELVHTARELAL